MARKRSIESSLWRSEKFNSGLSWRQKNLFVGLISFQDDAGRLHAEPDLIKSDVFPFDRVSRRTIEQDLKKLEDVNLLYLYEVNGRKYIQLHGIHHQKLDHPTPSRIPPHPDRNLLARISRATRERDANDSPTREVKRREVKGNSRSARESRKESEPWP